MINEVGVAQVSIDAIPHQGAIVDADGTIVAVNEAWRVFADRNHGTHPEYWVGENYFTICEQAEGTIAGDEIAAQLQAVLEEDDRDQYAHEHAYHSPEKQRWFRLDASHFDHNDRSYLLVTHTNITSHKLAELRADARAEQLETILNVLTHDLRNPLNIIDGYVEMLGAEVDDNDALKNIDHAVTRIAEITDATLTFTKSGALSNSEPLSVGNLAQTVWKTVATADATLIIEDSRKIIGDRRLLLGMFENLFRNAIEHAGSHCTVILGALETGFYVEDDGPGIPQSVREKAVQADYSTRGTGGLGLALVYAVVTAHGGNLTITDAANGGARLECTNFDIPPDPIET